MSSYLWAPSDRPTLGSMSATANLDDGAPGDTATSEQATQTETVPATPFVSSKTFGAVLTAVCDLGASVAVSGWSSRSQFAVDAGAGANTDLTNSTFTAEYLDAGSGQWMALAATAPTNAGGWEVRSQSGLTITTRYLRLVVNTQALVYQPMGKTVVTAARLADFRVAILPLCTPPPVPTLAAVALPGRGPATIRLTGA